MSSIIKATFKDYETETSPTCIRRFYGSPSTTVYYDENDNIVLIKCNCRECHIDSIEYEKTKTWTSAEFWLMDHEEDAFKDPINTLPGATFYVATRSINDFVKEYYPNCSTQWWEADMKNECFVSTPRDCANVYHSIDFVDSPNNVTCIRDKHNNVTCVCCACIHCYDMGEARHFESVAAWTACHHEADDPSYESCHPDAI